MSDRNTESSQGAGDHPEPILIFRANNDEEGEIVRATLEAAGIAAFLNTPSGNPGLGELDDGIGDLSPIGVYVSPTDREAAEAVLGESPLSETELSAEVDADTTTLEEAEKKANRG